jgi:ABC-type multidrug transport system fused ATPase/permease subunit
MVVAYRGLARDRPPSERATVRVMYGYVRPCRLSLLAGGVLSLATSAASLLLPLVVRELIDDLSRHQGLLRLIVIMCVLMLANAGLGGAASYVLLRAADSIVVNTRKNLTRRLLRITIGALDASVNRPGESGDSVLMMITLLHYCHNCNSRPAPISPAECRRSIRRGACC